MFRFKDADCFILKNGLRILFFVLPLIVFFVLGLFLDVKAEKSERERRMLAKKPEILSFDGGGEIEKYISDRIPFREQLLDLYFRVGLGFDFGTPTIIFGKEGWLFQNTFVNRYNLHNIHSYQNKLSFTPKEMDTIKKNVQRIYEWCLENNIHFYLIFPPDKHRVYARYMPSYILRTNAPSLAKKVAKILPKEIFVPLEDILIERSFSSPDPLYYKQESHWSETGAFEAYTELMRFIERDFEDVHALSKNDFSLNKTALIFSPYILKNYAPFTKGNLFLKGMQGYEDPIYVHYTLKDKGIKISRTEQFNYSDNPKGAPHRVYIIGDSYATYLHTFLSATFERVRAFRFNMKQPWGIFFNERKKEMIEDKTDILILSISDLKMVELLRVF